MYRPTRLVFCVLAGLLGMAPIPLAALGGEPVFKVDGHSVTITTDRWEAVWSDGVMVALASRFGRGTSLTIDPGTMSPEMFPNGLGSFHGNEKAGRDQHRALFSIKPPRKPDWPAMHRAYDKSKLDTENIPGGIRLTWTGLTGDPTAVLVQELTVDAATGELVVDQRGRSDNPGVFGIGFSLLNLKPDIQFALPYFGGQLFGGKHSNGYIAQAWPGFWSAGLVIGEVAGGGTFMVFADDPKLGPKYLKMHSDETVQGLGFEACTQWPYDASTEAAVCTWRINVYEGNWIEPAERYRQWAVKAYGLKPRTEHSPAWFRKKGLFYVGSPSAGRMKTLSGQVDPSKIIIVDLGWAEGFNRNAPFYRPRDKNLAETAEAIHELGAHYGVYVAHKLIDRHAHPELIDKYGLRLYFDGLSMEPARLDAIREAQADAERIAEEKKHSFLSAVHPGSDKWIEFYSDLMVEFVEQYKLDVLYQDVTGSYYGSCGLIDGRSIHEGVVAAERAIRRKLPQVISVGEHWNEVTLACGMEFGLGGYQAWFGGGRHHERLGRLAHPFMGYVFGPYTSVMMYKTPLRQTTEFHQDQNFLEVYGGWPSWKSFIEDDGGESKVVIERGKLFAEGFQPHYPRGDWPDGAVAYLKHPDGRLVKYLRPDKSTRCVMDTPEGDQLIYARILGQTAPVFDEPVHVEGWVAYGPKGPIGLDASQWYSVLPGKGPERPLTVTSLPAGLHVGSSRVTDKWTLIGLGGQGKGTLRWSAHAEAVSLVADGKRFTDDKTPVPVHDASTLIAVTGRPRELKLNEPIDLEDWTLQLISGGTVIGPAKWQYKTRPWKLGDRAEIAYGVVPIAGGPGAEMSVDALVELPQAKHLTLKFAMGRLGGRGDGVHFVVRVDGREIFRHFSPSERGWTDGEVSLAPYAGRTVVLSFAVDCGKSAFNLSNDQAFWNKPVLVGEE